MHGLEALKVGKSFGISGRGFVEYFNSSEADWERLLKDPPNS